MNATDIKKGGKTCNSLDYNSPFREGRNFRRSGWNYKCELRIGDIVLCWQYRDRHFLRVSGFVVAIIREKKRRVLPDGRVLCGGETFPSPSRFGKDGFFFMNKAEDGYAIAVQKMEELCDKRGYIWEPAAPNISFSEQSDRQLVFESNREKVSGGYQDA